MRHLFQFEKRNQPLASPGTFSTRLIRNGVWAMGVVSVSMAVGTAGYMFFENMSFIDAFANAAMILSGMGPLSSPATTAGKIFAGTYALFSGIAVLAIAGVIAAPLVHRFLHRMHADPEERR